MMDCNHDVFSLVLLGEKGAVQIYSGA